MIIVDFIATYLYKYYILVTISNYPLFVLPEMNIFDDYDVKF